MMTIPLIKPNRQPSIASIVFITEILVIIFTIKPIMLRTITEAKKSTMIPTACDTVRDTGRAIEFARSYTCS